METYIKNNHEVSVSSKFVYCISIYKLWKQGACLMDEKYYASQNPLDLKKIQTTLKRKNYTIQRYIELECAPEDYLISHGYKCMKV
jgi:hypothetical protein